MLYFELNLKSKWKLNQNDLDRLFKNASRILREKNKEDKVISIVTVSKKEMQALNQKTRRQNAPTDILAFVLDHDDAFFNMPFVRAFFGEIVICPSVAKDKAAQFLITEKQYEERLVAHGLLHLFGRDHKNDIDYEKMNQLEQKILLTV